MRRPWFSAGHRRQAAFTTVRVSAVFASVAVLVVTSLAVSAAGSQRSSSQQAADPPHAERPTAAFDTMYPLTYSAERRAAELAAQAQAQAAADAAAAAPNRTYAGSGSGTVCAAGDFECFKACTQAHESGGDYGAVSSGGTYRGAWQFDQRTWDSNAEASGRPDLVGQDPASAAPGDQDAVAYNTYQARGNQPWGGRCSS
jgi:hypothetical protein